PPSSVVHYRSHSDQPVFHCIRTSVGSIFVSYATLFRSRRAASPRAVGDGQWDAAGWRPSRPVVLGFGERGLYPGTHGDTYVFPRTCVERLVTDLVRRHLADHRRGP